MQLTLLGSGDTAQVPVYGCSCNACQRALHSRAFARGKTSACLEIGGRRFLLDANCPDLLRRFPAGEISAILLTHYHMDHVQALFDLRWGVGAEIEVWGPDDPRGCDDLFKHPGLLAFQPPLAPFESFDLAGIQVTPLPLSHSRPTLGYLFDSSDAGSGGRIAYLTDTRGLPPATLERLQAAPLDLVLLDCSYPPPSEGQSLRNHNDLLLARALFEVLAPQRMGLVHIGHRLDCWALEHPDFFDERFFLARDGQRFSV